jgi:hypothetical protein
MGPQQIAEKGNKSSHHLPWHTYLLHAPHDTFAASQATPDGGGGAKTTVLQHRDNVRRHSMMVF